MLNSIFYKIKISATIFLVALFFSCENDIKEIQDFLAEKNLPIGISKKIHVIHTDSGQVKTKLISPLLHDFSNRTEHPYHEFPKGIKILTYDKLGDSVTLTANYSKSYAKTQISEIKGNVIITNHKEKSKLFTEQLFWDQNTHYVYTEKPFRLITKSDTLKGVGFESNEDLSKVTMKNFSGIVYINESNKK